MEIRELWRQLERKIEDILKDGESELWNNLKIKFNKKFEKYEDILKKDR